MSEMKCDYRSEKQNRPCGKVAVIHALGWWRCFEHDPLLQFRQSQDRMKKQFAAEVSISAGKGGRG